MRDQVVPKFRIMLNAKKILRRKLGPSEGTLTLSLLRFYAFQCLKKSSWNYFFGKVYRVYAVDTEFSASPT
jgi:hypothetical protein